MKIQKKIFFLLYLFLSNDVSAYLHNEVNLFVRELQQIIIDRSRPDPIKHHAMELLRELEEEFKKEKMLDIRSEIIFFAKFIRGKYFPHIDFVGNSPILIFLLLEKDFYRSMIKSISLGCIQEYGLQFSIKKFYHCQCIYNENITYEFWELMKDNNKLDDLRARCSYYFVRNDPSCRYHAITFDLDPLPEEMKKILSISPQSQIGLLQQRPGAILQYDDSTKPDSQGDWKDLFLSAWGVLDDEDIALQFASYFGVIPNAFRFSSADNRKIVS